jgi:hypothetical protein
VIAVLAIATVIDLGLAALLLAASGFILEGVNNTGPMPGAEWYVAFVVFCLAAPIAAWILRRRAHPAVPLALVIAPIVIAVIAMAAESLFA